MNRIFAAYKPPFISSNLFLTHLKRKYREKSGGFSGTLDPFARGVLIVAFGQYTRLFQFLAKTPKRYAATLFLGAVSPTLDIEKIGAIEQTKRLEIGEIEAAAQSFVGVSSQLPPLYSAIRIGGVRAYKIARSGEDAPIAPREIEIFSIKITAYCHPFLSFECEVSEGCYVRSIGRDLAAVFGMSGALSSLTRLSEGRFCYENERALNPLDFIDLPQNRYLGDERDLWEGKKVPADRFEKQADGSYVIAAEKFFTIVRIEGGLVGYRLGRTDLSL
ncbi:tRNA pseudouridine synthase B [Campylobacterota bacterium]|nr:tRNA pseudouridine synthase B [Campylobacterota bacterium]